MITLMNKIRILKWIVILLCISVLSACEDQSADKATHKKASAGDNSTIIYDSTTESGVSAIKPVEDYSRTIFEILDFAQRDYKGVSSLALVLSVPLDKSSDFQQFFVLERKDGKKVDGAWLLSDNGKELFFKNIEAEQEYLITVYSNLKAINNKNLAQRYKQSITTKAIEASVSFAYDGGILPLDQAKGLPIYSVNTAQVDIEFHRVKQNKLTEFLQQWRNGSKKSTWQLHKYSQLSDFIYSARFDFPIEKNKRERFIIPINNINELTPAGIYFAVMKVPGEYDQRLAVSYFVRSNIGVHVRRYPGQLDVYLRSLTNGDALQNIQVSLLDEDSQLLIQTQSDAQGKLTFSDKLAKASVLLAQNGQQMSLVRLNSPALDLSEFNIGTRTAYQNEAFIYAPRDLYRPGESVDISLLLRNKDGQMIPDIPLKAVIKQENGQIVDRFTWQPEKLGYYHYNYLLANNAKTGKWSVEVKLPGNETAQTWFFAVEDFLPERMKLTLHSPEKGLFVSPEDNLSIAVEGQYLYGAPAAGNLLESTMRTYIKQEVIASLPGYLFGLSHEEDAQQVFDLASLKLNNKGFSEIKIPPYWQKAWQKIQSPITLQLTSSLFETGGRAVKRQTQMTLWPNKTLIAIRPHSDEPQENSLLKFDIINADHTGQLYPAADLQLTLIKKRRDYYWSYNESEQWQMEYSEKQYPVFKQTFSLAEQDKSTIEVPVEWGDYRLEIYNPATQLSNSIEFNAGGSWYYNNQQARTARPDKINLILDKPGYKNGESAQLTIKSPFAGKGMVLIENNKQALWQQEIDLKNSNEMTLEIPVKKDWNSHDIYISVILFNSVCCNNTHDIKRAIGLTYLPLDRQERQLELTIDSPPKSKPFTALTINIALDHPIEKEVMLTLAAVDVGVLNVSNFTSPDPFSWFFAQRRYNIDSLDLYGKIMNGRKGIMGKQRFGGDMDLASAGNLQKADSKIVSLFQQPVLFDQQGKAQITLDIPDFNGSLRLMAVAFADDSFGFTEQEVIIAAPVVSQLSLPRFLAANDKSSITLDVHNLSEQQQSLIIKLAADKGLEISDPVRRIELADQAKTTLNFTIQSQQQYGLSDINLHISNEDSIDPIAIERHWQLAVRPAWPALQRNQKVLLNSQQSASLQIVSDDLMPETLTGELLISNQPPINLAEHLQHLLNYPYGCLEQSTSSSFPWLFTEPEKMSLLGLDKLKIKDKPVDFSKRAQYLAQGVKKISGKQLSNGGFGLWDKQSSEEMWLTVYASHFLLKAKEQGVDVAKDILKPAVKRLQQYLRSTRSDYNYRYSQHPAHLTLAYKSYAAYVLSSIKQAPLGTMRTLFDYHKQDARSGLPLMHLGIALAQQGDLKRSEKAIAAALLIKREENQYLGDYGSAVRDLSLMLEALLQFNSDHAGIEDLLNRLNTELGKRQWLSTQERNALFMAGAALKQNAQSQWQALLITAATASEGIELVQQGDYKKYLSKEEIMQEIILTSSNKERLYADLNISAYTQNPPEENFEHFTIVRTYYNSKGEVILPDIIVVGDLIIVELSLQAKKRIQDALVVDLIPAGFEIENQNLEHSIKLDNYTIGDTAIIDRVARNEIKYQAWRDDRYIAAIDLDVYNSQRLYYILRAVTPGTYQIPPPYAEDMYRPYIRAIGATPEAQTIVNKAFIK